MEAIIAWVLSEAWPYMLGVGALVAGWFAARQSGKDAERREVETNERKAREAARNVRQNVDSLGDDAVRDRASSWVRRP